MEHLGLKVYIVCINDYPWLTLTNLLAMPNLRNLLFLCPNISIRWAVTGSLVLWFSSEMCRFYRVKCSVFIGPGQVKKMSDAAFNCFKFEICRAAF